MITKITSANDIELFAPRFEQITNALAVSEPTVRGEIVSAIGSKVDELGGSANIKAYFQSVVSEQKVRSISKEVLVDAFTSVLYENSTANGGDLTAANIEAGIELASDVADAAVAKAKEVGIVIDSIESYFGNLKAIAALQTSKFEDGKFLLVTPADEPYFEIDANTRVINIPAHFKKYGVGVQGDHEAELIVFKIDRYFDHQDFMETKIAINWNFTPNGSRVPAYEETQTQVAFAKDDELEPGYVVFGFFITNEMTPVKGTLQFAVTCYDTDNDLINYSFNTQTATLAINEGLTLEDPTKVKSVAAAALARLSNSAYNPDGVTPIADPEWQLGVLDEESKPLGLPAKLNFVMDAQGIEAETLPIITQAYAPGLVDMKYTWYSAVEDGIPAVVQPAEIVTKPSDYFVTTDVEPNDKSVYYVKNDDGTINTTPLAGDAIQEAFDDPAVEVYELGSSYNALKAGRYQVKAQAEKIAVRPNGTYIKTTSNEIESNVCLVPPAAKPNVSLVVDTAYEDDYEVIEETNYKYISASVPPVIKAVVSSSNDEPLGAVAVEVLKNEQISDLTEEDILAGDYTFEILPESGEKQVNAAGVTEEGEYRVRAINRRNHTYNVSEPSESIVTSFIAPKITKLDISTIDGTDKVYMLEEGARPDGSNEEGRVIELNNTYPERLFVIDDKTEAANKYADAVTSYYAEEVYKDPATGEWKLSYAETNPDPDEIEVLFDATYVDADHPDGAYTFVINRDSGIYRIRTENRYHGTLRIGYTDVFKVVLV